MVVHVAGVLVAQMEAARAEETKAEMKVVQTAVALVAWVTAAVTEVLEGVVADKLEAVSEGMVAAMAAVLEGW
jgi:NTP pyrophosphatase (non-canonical NTP hydrolase)